MKKITKELSGYAYDFSVDGIYYIINSDGKTVYVTYKDTNYNSYSGSVVIPPTVTYRGTTYSVTEIGDSAFYGCSGLTSVTIPNSVTEIGNNAFEGCSGLTSVTIPNSVTEIGQEAFENCSGLTSVTIPNSVTDIGYDPFSGTAWYNNQPDGLVYAGKVAYKYKGTMPDNTSITIKNGTLGIAMCAFEDCSGLTSVTIPNSVTSIGDAAFCNCIGLTSVTIPNSVTSIGREAFYGCSELTSVTIPNSVTSIGRDAFSGCSELTSVTIPNSVTSIGDSAFQNCSGLTSVVFNAENCTTMGSASYPVFDGCSNLTSLTIGENVKTIPSYAFYNCSGLTDLTIGSSVNSIGASAFHIARLGRIKVLNPVPPTCFDNTVFESVNKENCLLTVPHSTIDLYSTTYVWWDFKRMKEDNGQGDIATIDSDSVSVTATGGAIRVEVAEGAEAEVYSPSGDLLYRGTDSTIALQRGIYIVKVAGTTRK